MEIYLIRHAETEWNIEERLQGWSDSPLSHRGRVMAQEMGDRLRDLEFDMAYSSDLGRARESIGLLLKDRQVPIQYTDRLRELGLGPWEGKKFQEVKEAYPREMGIYFKKPLEHHLPNCENYRDLDRRIGSFLEELKEGAKTYRRVLVVGHGVSVQAILNRVEGIPLEDFWKKPLVRGMEVSRLYYGQEGFQIMERARDIEGKSY